MELFSPCFSVEPPCKGHKGMCLSLVEWLSLSHALNGVETGVLCREVIPLSEPLILYSTKILKEVGMTNYKN